MGLFDLFKAKKGDDDSRAARDASKWESKAIDRREQPGVRGEAIENLARMGTPEAAAILLRRFTFNRTKHTTKTLSHGLNDAVVTGVFHDSDRFI